MHASFFCDRRWDGASATEGEATEAVMMIAGVATMTDEISKEMSEETSDARHALRYIKPKYIDLKQNTSLNMTSCTNGVITVTPATQGQGLGASLRAEAEASGCALTCMMFPCRNRSYRNANGTYFTCNTVEHVHAHAPYVFRHVCNDSIAKY